MVTSVTSFSRSGLSDFVIQRVTALVIMIYGICVVAWLLSNANPSHADLVAYFGNPWMQAFSTLALLSTVAHAWIGMWTIGTDYVRTHYFGRFATVWRLFYQAFCLMTLFLYVLWGLLIIWGI